MRLVLFLSRSFSLGLFLGGFLGVGVCLSESCIEVHGARAATARDPDVSCMRYVSESCIERYVSQRGMERVPPQPERLPRGLASLEKTIPNTISQRNSFSLENS